jgi:hypothetical protein
MKKIIKVIILFVFCTKVSAQTIQTGIGTETVAAGVTLQLESSNKGFLIPRVSLTSRTSQSPLVGTLITGTTVFNTNTFGSFPNQVIPGVYYWDQEEGEWKPAAENDLNVSAKFFNASNSTNFYNGTNVVKMDILGTTYYNENPDIIQRVNATDLRIMATGLYEVTTNLAFDEGNSAGGTLGIVLNFRLNGTVVGTSHYVRLLMGSIVESQNSYSITEIIEIAEGQVLTITGQKANNINDVAFTFSDVGTSSLQIKRIR